MSYVMLQCNYKSDFVPITLDERYLFIDLVCIVCDRFDFNPDSIALSYVVRGGEKCFLRNEAELRDMRLLLSVLGVKLVDVVITDSSCVVLRLESSVGSSSMVLDEIENCDAESSTPKKVYMSAGWFDIITGVGQVFKGGASEFREALRKYSVERSREFIFVKNDSEKISERCPGMIEHDCGWFIKASLNVVDKSFIIREFVADHCCPFQEIYDANKFLNCKLISTLIQEKLRDDPSITASGIVSSLKLDYGFNISYYKGWMAIRAAKGLNIGDENKSYKLLERYIEVVHQTNPGSHIVLETDQVSSVLTRFKRFFISFAACIEGFKYVRPMLFIDGTFLKGKYKGTLLSAVGKNGNRGLYPIAFAVVDSENKENWQWFLEQLKSIVGTDRRLTFFSDRHIGLLESMSIVFQDSIHCYCLRHIKDNLKTRFSGGGAFFGKKRDDLVQLLDKCATAQTVSLFDESMEELIRVGGRKMKEFIDSIPVEKWTTAHAVGARYGETTSNAVESLNNWVLPIRDLPITEMIDQLRINLMEWYDARLRQSVSWRTTFCSIYQQRWDTFVHNSRSWDMRRSSESRFEVLSQPSHSVDLIFRECSCFYWQKEGFPCIHAVLCIVRNKLPVRQFVEEWFLTETYQNSYRTPINPVPSCMWRDTVVRSDSGLLPPNSKRQPERPKTKRIPSRGETVSQKRRMIMCGRCNKYANHNSRSCKEPIPG